MGDGGDIGEPPGDEEEADDAQGDERRFFRGEAKREGGGGYEQPDVPPRLQEAPHRDDEGEVEDEGEDVVSYEAAEVEERGGEGEHGGGGKRAPHAEPVPKEPGHDDERGAEDDGGQTGGGQVVAEDEDRDGGEVVEERPMGPRAVEVAVAVREAPAIEGVDRLVVVVGAAVEVPEAHGERRQEDQRVADELPGDPLDADNKTRPLVRLGLGLGFRRIAVVAAHAYETRRPYIITRSFSKTGSRKDASRSSTPLP